MVIEISWCPMYGKALFGRVEYMLDRMKRCFAFEKL